MARALSILICTGIFPPEAGGPATYSKNLAETLHSRGHRVAVITYRAKGTRADSASAAFPVVSVPRSWLRPWHYYRYFRAVKKYGASADVLFAQDAVSAGYPVYLANRSLRKPLVLKIVGDRAWEQAASSALTDQLVDEFQTLAHYPAKIAKMRKIQSRVAQSAEQVIVPSRYLQGLVSKWGVDPAKIAVIYNAVPSQNLSRSRRDCRRELGVAEQDFYVVSAGRDVPWKGFALLRDVVGEMQQSHSNIRLEIFHDLPRLDLLKNLRAADVFVLDSGYEGLSHLAIEALQQGAAAVLSKLGGNPEIIRDGENGLLVEYNNRTALRDALERLYADKALREHLADNARSSLQKFDVMQMYDKTEEILRRCAS